MKLVARIRRAVGRQARDLLAVAGIGSIAIGLGLVNLTLAFCAVGVFLLVAASSGRKAAG
jgi:hypothetical protein